MRLLDAKFKYTPSTSTNVATTWRRFGFRPTTEAERSARQRRIDTEASPLSGAEVTQLQAAKRKMTPPAFRLTVKK
ncbi:MAG TPA: hypothetical protein VLN59_13755 [Burkholderiales bacterium]|nr:hypothetical protein [Burkholderiales bacterium]